MGEFDFGEEHLKFLFDRWNIQGNLSETEKLGNENIVKAEEMIRIAEDLEVRLNKYIRNLDNWMEGI